MIGFVLRWFDVKSSFDLQWIEMKSSSALSWCEVEQCFVLVRSAVKSSIA